MSIQAQASTKDVCSALSRQVIGVAMEVQGIIGCGFVEPMYENALCYELDQVGIRVDKQVEVPVIYKDCLEIGVHRLDLLVEEQLILELKAVRAIDAVHYATVRSYLKATGLDEALILNFGRPRLDVRRVVPL